MHTATQNKVTLFQMGTYSCGAYFREATQLLSTVIYLALIYPAARIIPAIKLRPARRTSDKWRKNIALIKGCE